MCANFIRLTDEMKTFLIVVVIDFIAVYYKTTKNDFLLSVDPSNLF